MGDVSSIQHRGGEKDLVVNFVVIKKVFLHLSA